MSQSQQLVERNMKEDCVHAKVQVDPTHQATSPPGWIIVIINRNEA